MAAVVHRHMVGDRRAPWLREQFTFMGGDRLLGVGGVRRDGQRIIAMSISLLLIILLLVIVFGGGGYYAHGLYGPYYGGGIGIVGIIIILIVLRLVGVI